MIHGVSDKKTYSLKLPEGKMTVKIRLNEIDTIMNLKKYSAYPRILILYWNSYISENTITLYR